MDVITLSRKEISAQLSEIVQRRLPSPGKRQVTFNQVELLICYGLFYILDPHHYGGRNIHEIPEVVFQIAAFCKRPPRSFTNKMLNLDGSLKNSGRDEVLLFAQLSASPNAYAHLYQEILKSARHLSIDERQLPDFLGVLGSEAKDDTLLLGQEELPASNGYLLKAEQHLIREIEENFSFLSEERTEKLVEQRVRLTQHRFATHVLNNCGRRCVFCGFAPRTLGDHHGLLRASHIKPWSASDSKERMDVHNGLAACPIHDAGFDHGYLSVDERFAILRAPIIQQSMVSDTGVDAYFGAIMKTVLLLPSYAEKPAAQYLRYHQTNIFRG